MKAAQLTASNRSLVLPPATTSAVEKIVQEAVRPLVENSNCLLPVVAQLNATVLKLAARVEELQNGPHGLEGRDTGSENDGLLLIDGVDGDDFDGRALPAFRPVVVRDQNGKFLNADGTPRIKAPKTNILGSIEGGKLPFSLSLKTAQEYWTEFEYGLNGPPLRQLEDEHGNSWRSDAKIKTLGGNKSTNLKKHWSYRCPIYNWIIYRLSAEGGAYDEDVAVQEVQNLFEKHMSSQTRRPKMNEVSLTIRRLLTSEGVKGPYPGGRGGSSC